MNEIMSRDEARELLRRWGSSPAYMQRMERRRSEMYAWVKDAMDTLRAQNLTGMPRGGTRSDLADAVQEAMRRKEMYDAKISRMDGYIDEHLRMCSRIDELVERLTPNQQRVIELRYVDGLSWRLTAIRMNYDERNVRRIEGRAVDFIARSYRNE